MFGDSGEAIEASAADPHPKVGALTCAIRPAVPCMGCTFIHDIQRKRLKFFLQGKF
jgi:hypothetical protein